MTFEQAREAAFKFTKQSLRESVGDDQLIIQTISAIEELDKTANLLGKRLREWYELYSPEFSRGVADNEAFCRLIIEKSRADQLREVGRTETMGAPLGETDVAQMLGLAGTVRSLYAEREQLEAYLETLLKRHAANLQVLAGTTIAARLLREAGSLRKLATVQASTIQLYGAEKALFRHLKTGAKPPKYGHLINHPLVIKASQKDKGRVARALGDKISIACKVDFFKGEPIGESLRKALEERFG